MSIVTLQDEIVHYEVLGRGKPIIFLHGWVGSWRYWVPTMQNASTFRSYALDFWGYGDSARVKEFYTIDQQIQLLDLFLQEMGIGKTVLVGHGLGAIVAISYAFRYRQLVDRTMAVSLPLENSLWGSRALATRPGDLALWLFGRTPNHNPVRMEAGKADPEALQIFLRNTQALDISGMLQQLNTPCLLVYGQGDQTTEGFPTLNPFAQFPHNIHRIIFEQSGHYPMLDEPNKFNRLVTDFLSLGSGESPEQLRIKEEWKRRVR